MNINNNMNPMMGGGWWGGGLSGASLMVRSRSTQSSANNFSTQPLFRQALVDIRSAADDLRSAMRNAMGFGSDPSSPFGMAHAISANTDIMTITHGGRMPSARAQDFSVEVLQVATAQRNEGTAHTASARAVNSGFTQGNNQISITVGSSTYDFNISVSATDTNRDVQQRIASAINARNIGVTASVDVKGTGAAATSALHLQSTETGVAQANQPNFTVSGSAVSALGVGSITQAAQNAEFRVNRGFTGALQTSRSNTVDLGFGITAQLREAGTVEVRMGRDEVGQINAFRNMVNLYNDLVEVARENNAGQNGGRLLRELRGMINSNASALRRVGISMNQSGYLEIDEKQMAEAAKSGELERFAQPGGARSNTGFLNRIERMADRVGRHASNYVGVDAAGPMNFGNMGAGWNSQMNNWMNTGLLFDSMF